MVVVLQDIVESGLAVVRTPVSSKQRNLIFGSNTSLQKLIVTCEGSADDVSVVTPDAALGE